MIKSRMRWSGHVARIGRNKNTYRVLVGKPQGKRPLGRPKRRWENNIKTYLRAIEWGGLDSTDLVQWRHQWWALVNTVMNRRVS
jgi:hypothetical protein